MFKIDDQSLEVSTKISVGVSKIKNISVRRTVIVITFPLMFAINIGFAAIELPVFIVKNLGFAIAKFFLGMIAAMIVGTVEVTLQLWEAQYTLMKTAFSFWSSRK